MTINSMGGGIPPQFVLGPVNKSDATPAPTSRQVEIPAVEREFNTVPVVTRRPGGAPFHAGGPEGSTVPKSPDGSHVFTAQPVTGSPETPNAVLEQVQVQQTNNTETIGILLDRFA